MTYEGSQASRCGKAVTGSLAGCVRAPDLSMQTTEKKGLDIIGIFHSHPSSEAFPSNTDKKFMQSNPVTWIIYSGIEKKFNAFVLKSDVEEVLIEEN